MYHPSSCVCFVDSPTKAGASSRKLHGVHVEYGAAKAQGAVVVTGLSGEGAPPPLATPTSRRDMRPKPVVPSLPICTG